MEMIVLCGGKGVRLGSLTQRTPKPLLPIAGTPFLLRLLRQWKSEGVQRFILGVHYLADQFHEFADRYRGELGAIEVVVEAEPQGTGGAIRYAWNAITGDDAVVANGDSYVSQSLQGLREYARVRQSRFTVVAVSADRVLGGARQKGRLRVSEEGLLEGMTTEEISHEGWMNAGVYYLGAEEVSTWPSGAYDIEKTLLAHPGERSIRVLRSGGYLMDIGIPDCYARFNRQLGSVENLFEKLEEDFPSS